MRIGIVIVNYNRSRLVVEIVNTFSSYTVINQIAVVDNCSTDRSQEVLLPIESDKVKVIFAETNGGYAKGNNLGLAYLRKKEHCDICFVVNPDVFFEANVIETVVKYMEENPNYAIMTCAQIDPFSRTPSCQYGTRLFDTFWIQFLNYFNLPRHYYILKNYYVYSYDPNMKNVIEIAEALGSFFGIRMNCFDDGDVLDDGTFLYWEEQLLSFKVRARGYKIGFVSSCTYEHRHIQYSATTATKSLKLFRYNLQSQRYLQKKYLHFNVFQNMLISFAERVSLIERWIIKRVKPY